MNIPIKYHFFSLFFQLLIQVIWMKFLYGILLICISTYSLAQNQAHRWKKLEIPNKKIWIDEANIDTAGSDHIDIWVLEQHTPPLTFVELPGKIYRTKTLYTISLNSVKYGILQVIYYDTSSKELYNFNYHLDNYPDEMKYSYPVIEKSFLHEVLKEYFKKKGVTNN